MKIKKDYNFTLCHQPRTASVIKLPEGVKYLDTISNIEVEGIFKIYEYWYDEEGNRLDVPYTSPHNLVIIDE